MSMEYGDDVWVIRTSIAPAKIQIRKLRQFCTSLKNTKWFLIFSLAQVDFKFGTSLLMIMEHVGHQFSSCFHWIFKNAMFGNFALWYLIFKKRRKAWICVLILVLIELETWSFYRPKVWIVRQGSTWHLVTQSLLKGQDCPLAFEKEGSFFYHVQNYSNLIQSSIITFHWCLSVWWVILARWQVV